MSKVYNSFEVRFLSPVFWLLSLLYVRDYRAAKSSTKVVTFPGDISEEEEVCIGIIDTAAQEFGTIDVLVNNAGINGPEKKSPEITTKEWDEVLDPEGMLYV